VDYQESGDFLSKTVNDDFNRMILMDQQNREQLSRSLQYSVDDIVGSAILPNLKTRSSRFLAFDSTGNPVASLGTTPGVEFYLRRNNLAAMDSDITLNVGDFVETAGRLTLGDGGSNRYEIVAAGTGVDDGGSFIDLVTHQAKGLFPGKVANQVQFGAVEGGVTDALTAFNSLIAYAIANPITQKWLPGIWRVTGSIDGLDSVTPLVIEGDSAGTTFIYGDFIGAGKGILDISNSNGDSFSTKTHKVSGLGFLGNGVPGDPIGLKAENIFESIISNIDAPFKSSGIGRTLSNSVVVCTNDNNTKWSNIRGQAGFQPRLFSSITNSARVSFTISDATINATESIFSSDMVGKRIYFNSGSITGNNEIWSDVVASFTSATEIEITGLAPSTQTGAKCAVGVTEVTVTNGSPNATLNVNIGTDSDWVGMQMHIIGASIKTDAGNLPGILSTKILTASGASITMEDNATASGTFVVIFCPNVFIGSYEGDPAGRQTNHSWWDNLHNEGFQAAGLVINRAIFLTFDNLKLHGPNFLTASDWSEAYFPFIASEVKQVSMTGVQTAFCIHENNCWITGSRGLLSLKNFEQGHTEVDTTYITCQDVTDEFRLAADAYWTTLSFAGFNANYNPLSVPQPHNLEYAGPVLPRDMKLKAASKNPATYSPGVTAQYQRIDIADDTTYTFRPPGNVGVFRMVTQLSAGFADVQYRTSGSINGGLAVAMTIGAIVEVSNSETVLTGTTGTDGRITIGPDASGNLQVENRTASSAFLMYICTPFGDG